MIEGKFAYGRVSKDLEDEDVSLWMIERRRWRRIATARTDSDGDSDSPSLDDAANSMTK